MMAPIVKVSLFLGLLCSHSFLFSVANAAIDNNVVNVKVERTIDISTQLVKINSQVAVLNKANTPLKEYTIQFGDARHDKTLAYLAVSLVDSAKKKKALQVNKIGGGQGPFASYKVNFGSDTVDTGKSVTLEIEAAFAHLLDPYPEEISQADRQLVVYSGRLYFPTPYSTETQTTRVRLSSSSGVESYTKVRPVAVSDRFINYGPYDKIEPKTAASDAEGELRVHVENNTPFLTTERLERTIQVSHWAGVVSIEEVLDVVHTGAKLKGSFSRYEYQREPTSNGLSSIRGWKTRLPVGAHDIYYRDEIGNISTSNVRSSASSVSVDIRPRFPLFGGWKTQYTLGYTLPSTNTLFTVAGSSLASSEYVLKVPFVDHITDNMVIDEATVKIVLPEGASNWKLTLPYEIERKPDEVFYSYLDTIGRPVIVLSKKSLSEWHIQTITVVYKFSPLYLLQEPLLLVTGSFSMCLLVIVLVRTKTTLGK